MVDSALAQRQRLYLEPKYQNSDRSRQIIRADETRREQIYAALNDYTRIVAMTSKEEKVWHILKFLRKIMESDVPNLKYQAPRLPELASKNVKQVAEAKAAQIFGHGDHVDELHPATQELASRLSDLISLSHFIKSEGFDLIRQALPAGTIALAADVNFYIDEAKKWQQSHKLERKGGEVSQQEQLRLLTEMKQRYCFPRSEKIHVMWDNALVMLNGQVFSFHDRIEVISAPIDPELFDFYMNEALENGLFYSANTHFGLLECLIANQKIKTVAVLSDEEVARGLTIKDKRLRPIETDFPVLLAAVKGNRPPRLIQ